MFFVESSETSHICPVCHGTLHYRDSRPRICKKEGGIKEHLMIRRFRCCDCHSYHNELPDCLVSYKHYEAEVISGILDEVIRPEDLESEDYPSFAEENNISIRTLYRYEKAFSEGKFAGLRPADREKRRSQRLPDNFDFLLEHALQLRREVPERSVSQIIYILGGRGLCRPRRSETLHSGTPHIQSRGQKQMQMYKDARNSSSKRFCKPHRMMLIQGDIKYGPKLPIGKNGAWVQTYLSSAIDDHSRYLLASRFYDNQEEAIIEDTFHRKRLNFRYLSKNIRLLFSSRSTLTIHISLIILQNFPPGV